MAHTSTLLQAYGIQASFASLELHQMSTIVDGCYLYMPTNDKYRIWAFSYPIKDKLGGEASGGREEAAAQSARCENASQALDALLRHHKSALVVIWDRRSEESEGGGRVADVVDDLLYHKPYHRLSSTQFFVETNNQSIDLPPSFPTYNSMHLSRATIALSIARKGSYWPKHLQSRCPQFGLTRVGHSRPWCIAKEVSFLSFEKCVTNVRFVLDKMTFVIQRISPDIQNLYALVEWPLLVVVRSALYFVSLFKHIVV